MPKFFTPRFLEQEDIEAMNEREMPFPYSDKWLVYDGIRQQYIPTRELVIENGINIKKFGITPTDINNKLREVSDILYAFFLKANGSNGQVIKYIVAKSWRVGIPPYRVRKLMEKIFVDQCRYFALNGNLEMYNGVDITNGQIISRTQLRKEDREVFNKLIYELDNLGLYYKGAYEREHFGFNNIYNDPSW